MSSSIYKIPITINTAPITGNSDILTNDITFLPQEFNPGKSGLMRVWFCFETPADADTVVTVSHTSGFNNPTQLNADNNFVIRSKGLYRFDVPVTFDDSVNIRSSQQVDTIQLLRADCIITGS